MTESKVRSTGADMPTPETDTVRYDVEYETTEDYIAAAWKLARSLERRLAVQTALAESLAAKAQSLRLLVERAVELLDQVKDHYNKCPPCKNSVSAFLSEIRERKE